LVHKQRLGDWGESEAQQYLESVGYTFVERNFRVSEGEIDLIMTDGDIIVFVEVKTRISTAFGAPEEAISPAKKHRLQQAAWAYLQQQESLDASWRIDVIAIEANQNWDIQRMDHYPGAFDIEFTSQ
jgi:putative endonuclease